jgi:Zn-dependent M28 family amino/carboxypeptidase
VVVSGKAGEMFGIQKPDNNISRVPVEGWMTYDKTAELFKAAGLDLAEMKKASLKKEFQPVPLVGAKASFTVHNTLRKADLRNVIAKLEGSDPALKDEYIVYSAHWDHFGKDTSLQGDQIMNGARDNASGTAGLLEIARAYTKLPKAPKRSVLFLSVTAEEQGLLGAKYYGENPLYPLKKTLANINMDELNVWGRTKDMGIVGLGNSTLDDLTIEILRAHGRTAVGDPEPQKGGFFRSDHFSLAKVGIPAISPSNGRDLVVGRIAAGQQRNDDYEEHAYHQPSDEWHADWDLTGTVQDTRALYIVGDTLANSDAWPNYYKDSEFRALRDKDMAKKK